MAAEKKIDILFEILSNEQNILQRSDQKAFTLLSILGAFSIFFVVHYTKIPPTPLTFSTIFLYFFFVLLTIINLMLVVFPRINEHRKKTAEKKEIAPIFFGGIVQYKSPDEYIEKLNVLMENQDDTYNTFAKSVYSIGKINSYKHKHLSYGILCFVISLLMEFIVIVTLYFHMLIGRVM